MTMQAIWPLSPTGSYFSPHPQNSFPSASPYSNKPRVGLGVICLCQPQKYGMQCLLLKRGPKFVSPLKWSFPGGRLDDEGDMDDDGEKGTMRELKKECGGGMPLGLPPLIHIECYKSGRTFYHVYVLDTEAQTSWLQWQPSKTQGHTGEIDLTARELIIQGRVFPSFNGFCWVDLQTLIEDCMAININDPEAVSSNQLQHGLVRWVRTNGENILKTLLARSPNLAYQRRYQSSSVVPPNSMNVRAGAAIGVSPSNRIQLAPSRWLHPSCDPPRPPLLPTTVYQYPTVPTGIPTATGEYIQAGGHDTQLHMVFNHIQAAPPTQQDESGSTQSGRMHIPSEESPGDAPPLVGGATHVSSGDTNMYDALSGFQQGMGVPGGVAITTYETGNGTNQGMMHGGVRKPHPRRFELCRNYLITGLCPFGEKCWFVHPDGGSGKGQQREPLLGHGGVATPPMSPLQQVWHPTNYMVDQYMPHPPSPLGAVGPVSPTSWQFAAAAGGNRQAFVPMVRPGFPAAAAAQGGPVMFRPYILPGRFFGPTPGFQTQQGLHNIADPVLRFKLLSELQLTSGSPLTEMTRLSVRADHFYLSMDYLLRDYRILFGGDRSYNDSCSLAVEQKFGCKVTCLHSSKMQSLLVIVGLESGGIYCWDPRRNSSHSPSLTVVHEPVKAESAVTALIHFSTTIEGAQVVVSGHADGKLCWYIAQPPMKTFTVLSTVKAHDPFKVVSLQIFGGCLISGGVNGITHLWNMRSQEPTLADTFQAHSNSLLDIYVLDSSQFLTVGLNSTLTLDPATGDVAQTETTPISGETVDSITTNLAKVSLISNSSPNSSAHSFSNYSASIWDYSKSITNIKTIDNLGEVLVTAFHQQPMFGNQFLALGFRGGAVKIFNVPSFSVASEIHFPDIASCDCLHVALNLSREKENTHHFNMRNPFRDLILTTVWSDGRIMICQIEPAYRNTS